MLKSVPLQSIETRFRAYQLDTTGSSFSYYAGGHFTLIEARMNDKNTPFIYQEMKECGKFKIDTLHITSWDRDHCNFSELKRILDDLKPTKIEYPGYPPHTPTGNECLKLIGQYRIDREAARAAIKAICVDPDYIESLTKNEGPGYTDTFFHPKYLLDKSNDNSTVKLFRGGMFNVASLGDIEHPNLASMLRLSRRFKSEVDVHILAHHGSDNYVNGKKFFETTRPTLAICSNNYANQYDHPHTNVRARLRDLGIPLFTTKRGDVLITSTPGHRKNFQVTNYQAGNKEICETAIFESKKFKLLNMNLDTIRNRNNPGFKGLK